MRDVESFRMDMVQAYIAIRGTLTPARTHGAFFRNPATVVELPRPQTSPVRRETDLQDQPRIRQHNEPKNKRANRPGLWLVSASHEKGTASGRAVERRRLVR